MQARFRLVFSWVIIAGVLAACGRSAGTPPAPAPLPVFKAELARTTHGVAHVRADDFRGLGYGLAYAYAQDNVCMFADSLLTARGERSRFFGGDARATRPVNGEYGAASDFMDLNNADSDFFFKGYLDIDQLRAGYAAGSKDARDLLEGYAAGYNRYLKDYAGRYPAACNQAAWVRPMTADDMMLVIAEKALHASGEVFAKEIVAGARDPGVAAPATAFNAPRKIDRSFMRTRLAQLTAAKLGSNGLAIGKDLSLSGRGILLGNPHYPWTSTDRFYQAHMTIPGRYDAMGVTLGGLPIIVIGFNKDVAWTHTVTTAVHFTTFRLALDPGDASGTTYLSDGARIKMTAKPVTIEVRMPDGSMASRQKTFYFSKQGAVLVKPEAGLNWTQGAVHALADPNRNNTRLMEQWIALGSSASVQDMKAALDRIVGLPWINTVAADRAGNTLYADASVVPHVGGDKFASDCLMVPPLLMFDGSRSSCGWGQDAGAPAGIYAPADGPWMIRTDYVGNSNDSYWLTNPRALFKGPAPFGFSPLYGAIGIEQKLRTRIGFRQLEEMIAQRRRLQPADLQELMFANRVYAAELILPDLLPLCAGDASLAPACNVLAGWDRRANLDSRGAVLFREFWNLAATIPGKWAAPLDPADPVNTPSGLAPGAAPAMLGALKAAVKKLQALAIPLDGRLGDFQDDTRAGVRVPVHGAIGDIDGSYNSIHMATPLDAGGYHDIAWGSSYIQAVTFDDAGPVAQAMLVYGQSVDPKSPYYNDQVPLFSGKQWPSLPFGQEKIKADPNYHLLTLSE
ncbi:penicillin acylase family protein [Massilia sp. R2A-15]|uniref:penicillin acylase family protein n=1 Tax=Massilia sp. R2A-15 TaxID=3064278 RepID=UPI0027332777|nr:penicillin acylase family protein [Massilia sp. R2A-15]WLI88772.1 penicillin acylase family protein [Massilia sp. R2A-15]